MKARELKKLLTLKDYYNIDIRFSDMDGEYDNNGTLIFVIDKKDLATGLISSHARKATKAETAKFWNKDVVKLSIDDYESNGIQVLDAIKISNLSCDRHSYVLKIHVSKYTKEQRDAQKKKKEIESAKRTLENLTDREVIIGKKRKHPKPKIKKDNYLSLDEASMLSYTAGTLYCDKK